VEHVVSAGGPTAYARPLKRVTVDLAAQPLLQSSSFAHRPAAYRPAALADAERGRWARKRWRSRSASASRDRERIRSEAMCAPSTSGRSDDDAIVEQRRRRMRARTTAQCLNQVGFPGLPHLRSLGVATFRSCAERQDRWGSPVRRRRLAEPRRLAFDRNIPCLPAAVLCIGALCRAGGAARRGLAVLARGSLRRTRPGLGDQCSSRTCAGSLSRSRQCSKLSR